ncbi:hypothetical protein Hanom_Chr04g00351271 [Helianthus anomalus]
MYSTMRNKRIDVTEERIHKVLKLQDNANDPISLRKDDILDEFRGMRYVGDFRQKNEIKRGGLTRGWRFIVHVFAMSLVHRKVQHLWFNLQQHAGKYQWTDLGDLSKVHPNVNQ